VGGIYWLASYPKSGNTWFRAFLYNLNSEADTPADINDIRTGSIASARGWLDEVLGFDTADLSAEEIELLRPEVYRWSRNEEEIGYHKIHDAYTLLPNGEPLISREGTLGAVYIVRNPLDLAPSNANHMNCTIDQAIAYMGDPEFSIARKHGSNQVRQKLLSWSEHVVSWVDASRIDIEVIRYEDMLGQPLETFTRAATFLELPTDPTRVERAIEFSSYQELSRQEDEGGFAERPYHTSRFFRRGEAGGWQDTLSPEQVKQIIADHGATMRRFGYLDSDDNPVERPQ
jgi:hypothetical protein